MKKLISLCILLAALFSIVVPQQAEAGDGGYIILVNGTPYDWERYSHDTDDMEAWKFPATIRAGETVRVYIEFHWYWDSEAETRYRFAGTEDSDGKNHDRFHIYVNEDTFGQNLKVWLVLNSPNTPTEERLNLGFDHDGERNFIIAGDHDHYLTNFATWAMDWMSRGLPWIGDLLLSQLVIPGSHDAGMSETHDGTFGAFDCNTLTQDKSIYDQLQYGARYFDIRPVIGGVGDIHYTGHYGDTAVGWQGVNGQSIDDIVANINEFTASHNELVILHLSHARNTNEGYRRFNADEWSDLFSKLEGINHRYIETDSTKISELKELTLNELISDSSQVIILVGGKDCDATSDILPDTSIYYGQGFFPHESFDIYDEYANKNEMDPMKNNQNDKLWAESPSNYFLYSWTLTQNETQATTCSTPVVGGASIKELAEKANPHLPYNLYRDTNHDGTMYTPNIIHTDFVVNNTPAMLALALNYRYDKYISNFIYLVTATAGINGFISPPLQPVQHGSSADFTVTPMANYHIDTVSGCGGSLSGNTYTTGFIIGNCTVTATFAIDTFTVTPSAGDNGSIDPDATQTVAYGASTSFGITPNLHYHIDTVSGCEGSLSGSTYTTGAITADCTVTATFAIDTFTVTPSAGDNGSIDPSSIQSVDYGASTKFGIIAAPHYHIDTVSGCEGSLSGSTYTTGAITADCTVTATFAIDTFTVTPSAGENGSTDPDTAQSVDYGASTSFGIIPDINYHIDTVSGCGGGLLSDETTYTTAAITDDCTVEAIFAKNFPWHLFLPAITRPCPHIPDFCYLVADGDNEGSRNAALFTYTFETDTMEFINRLGAPNVEAIVLSLDGETLFAADNGVLGIIDPGNRTGESFTPLDPAATDAGTARGKLGPIVIDDIDGLAYDPVSAVLYGANRYGDRTYGDHDLLIQLDPASGKIIANAFGDGIDYLVIDTSKVGASDIDDIAIDLSGTLYAIAGNSSDGNDHLVIIDKTTGAVSGHDPLYLPHTRVHDMEGLTFFYAGDLYGTTGIENTESGTENSLYKIKSTGETEFISPLDQDFDGYIPGDFEAIECFPVCR